MKCDICGKEIKETFFGKIDGTYIYFKGKYFVICSSCQKRFKSKEEILKELEKLGKLSLKPL